MLNVNIGFIGAGNMAKAIAFGLVDAGAIDAKNIFASAPTMNHLKSFRDIGINVSNNNNDVIKNCDIIFLAIKPQYLDVALSSLNDIPHEGKLYISILAGVKLETFEKKFRTHCKNNCNYKIIRVLPNTPILVGAGCTVMAANAHTSQEEVSLVKEIMSYGGSCDLVPEHLISPCSAVCGSGPAFVSRDINLNLESNNRNKTITSENASPKNFEKAPCYSKTSFSLLDNSYRENNDISSSEYEDSEYTTLDVSDADSLSDFDLKILRKKERQKFKIYTAENSELKKWYFSKDYYHGKKNIEGFHVNSRTSSCTRNNEAGSPKFVDFIGGINEIYKKDRRHFYDLLPRSRYYTEKYLGMIDDQADILWNWDRHYEGNYQYRYCPKTITDYHNKPMRDRSYYEDNYFLKNVQVNQEFCNVIDSDGVYNRRSENMPDTDNQSFYPIQPWNIAARLNGIQSVWRERLPSLKYNLELPGKRKMAEDSFFYQPIVKRSRQNPVLHPLQVAIIRFSQEPISNYMAAMIRRTLILMINSTFGSGFSPKFENSYLLQNGHFLVSCSDNESMVWLLKQKLTEEDGTSFVIMKLVDIPLMKVIDVFIPYNKQPVKQVLQCLAFQNHGLKTDKWLFAKRSFYRSGQNLKLVIDKDSCKLLELLNWKPYFQLCRINFQKVNSFEEDICVLCKSFSKICNLCSP